MEIAFKNDIIKVKFEGHNFKAGEKLKVIDVEADGIYVEIGGVREFVSDGEYELIALALNIE